MSKTVTQTVRIGQEFVDALVASQQIEQFIFFHTNKKTIHQITFILGDIRRFCNAIEHELIEKQRTTAED